MNRKTTFLLLVVVLAISLPAIGAPWDGSGTAEFPYLIYDADDMQAIGGNSDYWSSHFKLMADIDLSAYTGTQFNIIAPDTDPGTPGHQGAKFTGSFDGNGHTISNFTYTSTGTYHIGLFGSVGSGGEIKYLGLTSVNVDAGTGRYVGGLVGFNRSGTVSNCYATGSVSGGGDVGGLVGLNWYGTVSNCYATGSVSGIGHVGGLVGINLDGTVSNCQTTGSVTGTWEAVGGLVGINWYGTVSNCQTTGSVTGVWYVGGLVAENRGTVSNCQATGSVTGTGYVGGLVAENDGTVSNCYATGSVTGTEGRIGGLVGDNHYGTNSNSYATGTVSGKWNVGGLVGYNSGSTVSNCYATGPVTGDWFVGGLLGGSYGTYDYDSTVSNCYATGSVSGTGHVGGLVGKNYFADIFASFWDTQTTSQANGVGLNEGSETVEVYGRTTTEMQTESTFTDYGWDFTTPIWKMCYESDYPRLWWEDCPVPSMEVWMNFTPQALNPDSQGNWVKAHLVLPEGFGVDDVDADTAAEIEQLGIESEYMNVFINEDGLVEIEAAFRRGDFCGGVGYGPAEVTVTSRLVDGRYLYGTDTIRIINKSLEYVAVFVSHWLEADCGGPDWCGGLDVDRDSVVDFVDFALLDGCCIEIIRN